MQNLTARLSLGRTLGLASLAIASHVASGQSYATFSQSTVQISVPPTLSVNCLSAEAIAYAAGFALPIHSTLGPDFNAGGDVETNAGSCSANARAFFVTAGYPSFILWQGDAESTIGLTSTFRVNTNAGNFMNGIAGGGCTTGGSLAFALTSSGRQAAFSTATVNIAGSIGLIPSGVSPDPFSTGRRFEIHVPSSLAPTCEAVLIETANGTGEFGVSLNPATGDFEFSCSEPIALGTHTSTSVLLRGSDDSLDVSGDRRFNPADAVALSAELGYVLPLDTSVTPPVPDPSDPLTPFDFNRSGDIDQSDVDILTLAASTSASAGTFGDGDGNGVIDCNDKASSSFIWNAKIDGSAPGVYVVEYDVDLDGDLDATDQTAHERRFGDLVAPFGVTDLADIDAFIIAFAAGDPLADIAPPFGVIDLTDSDAFISIYGLACP